MTVHQAQPETRFDLGCVAETSEPVALALDPSTRFSIENMDEVLITRLSMEQSQPPTFDRDFTPDNVFFYLVRCWRRAHKARTSAAQQPFQSALQHLKGLLISYIGIVIQAPEMFPNSAESVSSDRLFIILFAHVYHEHPFSNTDLLECLPYPGNDKPLLTDLEVRPFLTEIAARFPNRDDPAGDIYLDEVLAPSLQVLQRNFGHAIANAQLPEQLRSIGLYGKIQADLSSPERWVPWFQALEILVQIQPCAVMVGALYLDSPSC